MRAKPNMFNVNLKVKLRTTFLIGINTVSVDNCVAETLSYNAIGII